MADEQSEASKKDLNLSDPIQGQNADEPMQTDLPANENLSDITNPQKPDMEIYHTPDLHHKKKPWREYLIEFFMIFLAVTLGFFAESLREFNSDNHHVRQLASQLIQDLINDSMILSNNISKENLLIRKSDSLFYLLQQPLSKVDTRRLQELVITCYSINLFQPSSGAISAIKNELHLKQFARSNITLYISNYETFQALLKTIEKFQEDNLKEYVQGFITAHFTPSNAYSSLSSISSSSILNGDLRNLTQTDLVQLSIDIVFVKNYNALLAEISKQLMGKSSEFIQYANKEFE
jgi:hypothetical protein